MEKSGKKAGKVRVLAIDVENDGRGPCNVCRINDRQLLLDSIYVASSDPDLYDILVTAVVRRAVENGEAERLTEHISRVRMLCTEDDAPASLPPLAGRTNRIVS